jgi:urease beta subunit
VKRTSSLCLLAAAALIVVAMAPSALAAPDRSGGNVALRIANVDLVEGDDGITRAVFAVTASRPVRATVEFSTVDGTALAGLDYELASGTLTFTKGRSMRRVVVDVLGDSLDEVDERFTVRLSHAVGAMIADPTARATISDDDAAGPTVSIGDSTISEAQQSQAFIVTLAAPMADPVTVDFATADGTATAPADYGSASGTLTFEPGQTVKQVVVSLVGDQSPEINETYSVNLSNATGASIGDGVAVGTITDNDTPTITVANVTVTEGNFGTVNAIFVVTLSAQSSQAVSFEYATADGSATAPTDYTATTGSLTFEPGQTVKQIVVPVVGDTAIETAEAFALNLSNPVNATFADPAAQGTITDNDTVTISIGAATVTETNIGTRDAVFTVTLSAVSGNTVTVDYATADGSATAGADYVAVSGTLTFAPGEVSKQIVVQVIGDTLVEANETYSVNLSAPVNATIAGSGYGLGTITNND